jgi:hypothetical protein
VVQNYLQVLRQRGVLRKASEWVATTRADASVQNCAQSCKWKKVKLALCSTKNYAMESYEGAEVEIPRLQLYVSGQLHAPAALPQQKSHRYLTDRRLGRSHSRSERVAEEIILDANGARTTMPRSSIL